MNLTRPLSGLRTRRAETHPEHADPTLRGRTYAISFARIWKAAREAADGGIRGWTLMEEDEDRGILEAEARTPVLALVHEVEIHISLDPYGQTRVDVSSASRGRRRDLGRDTRRIRKFFRVLDDRVGAGPKTILDSSLSTPALSLIALTLFAVAGCSRERGSEPGSGETGSQAPASTRNLPSRNYERNIVFFAARGDSTLLVPWFFTARSQAEGVEREVRGWLARGGAWDPFFHERWMDRPNRAPWRILPRGPVRLTVGAGDAIEEVRFQEGGRNLEVILGDLLVEWSGQRAQTYRVQRGTTVLSDGTVEGLVVDASRAWTPQDPAPGDWGFLISGDSLQMVLEDQDPAEAESGGSYACWARLEFLDRQWQGIQLVWSDVRSFEPARREVPMSWTIRSPGGDVGGSLDVVAPFLEAGEGEGPLLPVRALFQVEGDVTLNGRSFPVRGFLRHRQG